MTKLIAKKKLLIGKEEENFKQLFIFSFKINSGIYQRVWIERGAALGADVFTTISDITNLEAKNFLGRSADILLPNGLQVEK